MPLRQVQAYPLQRHRLRPLRRGSDREEGAPRTYGAHFAGRSGSAYLVFPFTALENRLPVGDPDQETRSDHLLRTLRSGSAGSRRCERRGRTRPAGRERVPRYRQCFAQRQPTARRLRPGQVHRHDGRRSDLHAVAARGPRRALLFAAPQGQHGDLAAAQGRSTQAPARRGSIPRIARSE